MKILIAYYSKTGNTKRVAHDIAQKLGADVEELVDKKKRTGLLGYFRSGRDGMKKIGTEIGELSKDPAEYDLVITGSPVWGWNIVPAVRTYLEQNKGKIKSHAFFVTSGNTDSEKLVGYLKEIMDSDPLAHVGFSTEQLKEEKVYGERLAKFVDSVQSAGSLQQ
jgi:flavodoxin